MPHVHGGQARPADPVKHGLHKRPARGEQFHVGGMRDKHLARIELELLRSRSFSGAFGASILYYAGFGAFVLSAVEFLTGVWHYSPALAGGGYRARAAHGPAVRPRRRAAAGGPARRPRVGRGGGRLRRQRRIGLKRTDLAVYLSQRVRTYLFDRHALIRGRW